MKKEDYYKLSIRSRFAFGMVCVENALSKFELNNSLFLLVIDKAWEFTKLKILDEWFDEIREIMPWGILDTENILDEIKYINSEQAYELKELYLNSPKFIIDCLDDVIWIALKHFYTDIPKNSEGTAYALVQIVNRCVLNGIEIPKLDFFIKSEFSEDNGWGFEQEREFYLGGNN